jgi:hypothetical protein
MEIDTAVTVGRAVRARDAADRRVRIATAGVVALATALTGGLAALASGSTHAKRVVTSVEHVRARSAAKRPVVAPAPPLVGVNSAPTAAPPSSPAEPPAVAAPTQPPVVVSGGS